MPRIGKKIIILIIASIFFTAPLFQSCGGGEKFVPFADVPIAGFEHKYFMSMCENQGRYINMFEYLVIEYYRDRTPPEGIVFDYDSPVHIERKRQFDEWKELHPEFAARMEGSLAGHIRLTDRVSGRNPYVQFDKMEEVIIDFLNCQFMRDPELLPEYASLVSEEFLNMCGPDVIQQYCDENGIAVVDFKYEADAVTHFYYPFSFDYTITIQYTEKGAEPAGKNIKTQALKLRCFVGMDASGGYVVEYVADIKKITVIPAPPLPAEE